MKNTAYKIRESTFNEMQKEAGLVLTYFDFDNPYDEPETQNILATTDGGLHLKHETPMIDLGDGVDNCPTGLKELMEKDQDNISLEFTSITFNPENIVMSVGAADAALKSTGATHIYPRKTLKSRDFKDIICLFPMTGGGMCGAKLSNALTSNGLDITTAKGEHGKNSVTLVPHASIYAQNVIPIEYYFIPAPELDTITVTSAAGSTTSGTSTITLSGYTPGTGETYKYKVDTAVIDVEYGDIIGEDWTTITSPTTITAATGKKITVVSVDTDGYAVASGSATITAKA